LNLSDYSKSGWVNRKIRNHMTRYIDNSGAIGIGDTPPPTYNGKHT